ncbi:hypothetical protein NDU88_005044 [Pleurodeles waltl]|uniref:Uncharacterized protein n=1 Tax=Pleurodeles waltl TaxID=8319 RepID=A0AAV7TU80_PLEWA|nr:hypothetical protein NDU88_005044 [Pleurodeles waltl]
MPHYHNPHIPIPSPACNNKAWTPITKACPLQIPTQTPNQVSHKVLDKNESTGIQGHPPIPHDGTHRCNNHAFTPLQDPYPTSPDKRFQTCPLPPTEEAHSDDSSSVQLDLDDQPGPSGTSGQSVPHTLAHATTEPPPSGNASTAPSQWAHPFVPRTRQAAVCPPLQETQANPPTQENQGPGGSGSGHTVQGTEAQDNRGTGRTAVRQGEDRPREPTLHEAFSNIMGAYHHSQETMATVLAKFQETQRLQEEQYLGIREELKSINTTLVTIVGVLKGWVGTRRDTVAQQGAPDTSLDDKQPTTSAGASGQEVPPQDHDTSTPPPADGEPPRTRSLRSRTKTENNDKTPARK